MNYKKIASGFILLLLSGLFGWLFFLNFLYAESYELLLLGSIDEFTFNNKINLLHFHLVNGEWLKLFETTDFDYGNIFWSGTTLLRFPFRQWGSDELSIVFPRQISWLCYVLCFGVLYKIIKRLGYDTLSTLLALLLVSTCTGAYSRATEFHNHTILAFLILSSFYFLLKTGPWNLMAALGLFGLALGLKVIALLSLPLFIIFLLWNSEVQAQWQKKSWRTLGSFVGAWVFILAVAALAFNPLVLLWPFGHGEFMDSLRDLRDTVLGTPPGQGTETGWQVLRLGYSPYGYHWSLLFVFGGIGLALVIYDFVWKKKISFAGLIGLLSILQIVFTAYFFRQALATQAYTLVPLFVLALFFLDVARRVRMGSGILLGLIVFNLFINYPLNYSRLTEQYNVYYRSEHQMEIQRAFDLQKKLRWAPGEDVAGDHLDVPMPVGYADRINDMFHAQEYIMYDPEEIEVFYFSKHLRQAQFNCPSHLNEKLMQRCLDVQQIFKHHPDWEAVYEDGEILVLKRKGAFQRPASS